MIENLCFNSLNLRISESHFAQGTLSFPVGGNFPLAENFYTKAILFVRIEQKSFSCRVFVSSSWKTKHNQVVMSPIIGLCGFMIILQCDGE